MTHLFQEYSRLSDFSFGVAIHYTTYIYLYSWFESGIKRYRWVSNHLPDISRKLATGAQLIHPHSPSSQGCLRWLTHSTFEIRVIFHLHRLPTNCLSVKSTNQSISFQWQGYFLSLFSFIYLQRPFSKLKCSHFVEQYLPWQCEKF